jgi:hypothetical protein
MAERAGFEPAVLSHTAFRERHLKPLGHLSDVGESSKASPKGRQTRRILASAIHAPRLQRTCCLVGWRGVAPHRARGGTTHRPFRANDLDGWPANTLRDQLLR